MIYKGAARQIFTVDDAGPRIPIGEAALDNRHQVNRRGDTLGVELFYPRVGGHVNKLRIGLCDIRAADDILIAYDFKRDGWSIKQASIFQWDVDDEMCDPDWQEVAFVQAWVERKRTGKRRNMATGKPNI